MADFMSTFGLVLSDAIVYWRTDPTYLVIPCLMLITIVLALNLFGDAVAYGTSPIVIGFALFIFMIKIASDYNCFRISQS